MCFARSRTRMSASNIRVFDHKLWAAGAKPGHDEEGFNNNKHGSMPTRQANQSMHCVSDLGLRDRRAAASHAENHPRVKTNFFRPFNLIAPVQPSVQKHFAFAFSEIDVSCLCPVPVKRGASRPSRTLGAGCGGRVGLQCGSFTRTNNPMRTAKPCGPGIPVLMPSESAFTRCRDMGARQPVPRESAEQPLKLSRREGRLSGSDLW